MRIPIINRFTCYKSQLKNTSKILNSKGYRIIYDYSNENYKNSNNNYTKINNLIKEYPNNMIAVKLSSLNIKNDPKKAEELIFDLCYNARKYNSKILVDSENFLIQDNIEKITDKLIERFNKNHVNVYKTYQMYRKDTYDKLLNDISKKRNYYLGIKLVRGAYYNQDYKYNILFDDINKTHDNYNNGIELFSDKMLDHDQLIIASHNKESNLLGLSKNNNNIKYSQLMGMSDNLSNLILSKNGIVFKYLPFGNLYEVFPYLVRRLYENPKMFFYIYK